MYYTDTIEITTVTENAETKAKTEDVPFLVKGYWEESSGIKYGKDGLPVVPEEWVFFPKSVNIKKGDLLRLTMKDDTDVSANPDYTDKRLAKKVNMVASLGMKHFEVQI